MAYHRIEASVGQGILSSMRHWLAGVHPPSQPAAEDGCWPKKPPLCSVTCRKVLRLATRCRGGQNPRARIQNPETWKPAVAREDQPSPGYGATGAHPTTQPTVSSTAVNCFRLRPHQTGVTLLRPYRRH
jgi:hypothetical protein